MLTRMPRMAGTSTGVYEFHTVVRGHHVYKTVWTPVIDETLQVAQEGTSRHNKYTVAISKGGCTVGHISREILRIINYVFLNTWHHHMHNHHLLNLTTLASNV